MHNKVQKMRPRLLQDILLMLNIIVTVICDISVCHQPLSYTPVFDRAVRICHTLHSHSRNGNCRSTSSP